MVVKKIGWAVTLILLASGALTFFAGAYFPGILQGALGAFMLWVMLRSRKREVAP